MAERDGRSLGCSRQGSEGCRPNERRARDQRERGARIGFRTRAGQGCALHGRFVTRALGQLLGSRRRGSARTAPGTTDAHTEEPKDHVVRQGSVKAERRRQDEDCNTDETRVSACLSRQNVRHQQNERTNREASGGVSGQRNNSEGPH